MTVDEIRQRLADAAPRLQEAGIARIVLFGSLARGEAQPSSDIDLCVDPAPGLVVGGLRLAGCRSLLAEILGVVEVDVVTREFCRPEILEAIVRDGVVVFRATTAPSPDLGVLHDGVHATWRDAEQAVFLVVRALAAGRVVNPIGLDETGLRRLGYIAEWTRTLLVPAGADHLLALERQILDRLPGTPVPVDQAVPAVPHPIRPNPHTTYDGIGERWGVAPGLDLSRYRAEVPALDAEITANTEVILALAAEVNGCDTDGARLWFASEPIPGLGGLTAQALVEQGRAAVVRRHLEAIRDGGSS